MVDIFVFIGMVAVVGVVRYNTSHEHTPTSVNKMSPMHKLTQQITHHQTNERLQTARLSTTIAAAARDSHSAVEASMEISNLVCQRKLPCLVSIVSV